MGCSKGNSFFYNPSPLWFLKLPPKVLILRFRQMVRHCVHGFGAGSSRISGLTIVVLLSISPVKRKIFWQYVYLFVSFLLLLNVPILIVSRPPQGSLDSTQYCRRLATMSNSSVRIPLPSTRVHITPPFHF